MNLTALLLAASLGATPTLSDERPLWAGSLRTTSEVVLVAAVPGGLGIRSAAASVLVAGDASAALGAGLCAGTEPRLAIPAGKTLFLLGPGSPAALVATVSLPSQAISAAVPLVTPTGCQHAVVLQSGDVAVVGPSGSLATLAGLLPATADWHEWPRGVLVASRQDLLVVGGVDGSLAAVQMSDGKRFSATVPSAAVPGAVWSDGQAAVWFLGKTGSLHSWRVATEAPVLVQAASVGAPGGLVAWGGKSDRGIAWADMNGQVFAWKDGKVRQLVRLPAAVRWPMLVADLDDSGDLKLVAPVDGSVAALVTEETAGASFQLLPLAARPAGSPVAYQLDAASPPVLAIPAGPTRGAFQPADGVPAGQLVHEQAILNAGSQIRGYAPGEMTAAVVAPAGASTTLPVVPPVVPPVTPPASETAPAKSGFGCTTAPTADALPLLLAPLLLLRRRRSAAPRLDPDQGKSGV